MASPLGSSPAASTVPPAALPALPSAWPADLAAAVAARAHARLTEQPPAAPSLDLGRPEGRRLLRDAAFLATGLPRTGESGEAAEPGEVPQPATFASIVSVAALVHFADLPLALRGMTYLLAPGGRVHLVEPIAAPGVTAFVRASLADGLGRWRPEVRGLHLHRDVPAAVRAEGLTLATIERFAMPASVPTLRVWMHGVAAPITAATDPPAGEP
jgi:hypothetical protein